MSNRLSGKYLVRGACGGAIVLALSACGGAPEQAATPKPEQATAPLPTAGIAGQRVSILPITLVAAEDSLEWHTQLADRRVTLARADSLIAELIGGRAPEVTWVLPSELRQAARRSAGVAPPPDQIGSAILRVESMVDVPDPLRSQLRTLVALAGGRYALVPAAIVYRRLPERQTAQSSDGATGTAELSLVLVDARVGKVGWRTVARGDGPDPWTALTAALKKLTPGLP